MSKELNEKQRIELLVAKTFLGIYNSRTSSDFEIVNLSDTPDVICEDPSTGEKLFLEITLLEDWDGDIRSTLGRGDRRKLSPITGLEASSFGYDTLRKLRERLEDKLLSVYGTDTALVIYQVSPLWSGQDYELYAHKMIKNIMKGRETNFGRGIWIVCTNTDTFPAEHDIYSLSELAGKDDGEEDEPTGTDPIRAKYSYEHLASDDFWAFASQDDVDPVVRIASPHGCNNSILVVFKKDEPEYFRTQAIDFLTAHITEHCSCGKGRQLNTFYG